MAEKRNGSTSDVNSTTDEKPKVAEPTTTKTDDEVEEDDADVQYPKAFKKLLITLSLCFSIFCLALDNTILATAIPKITDQFGSINDVGWYGSSYLLTTCAFQLGFGKLYTFLNLKWVYLIALGLFELGSLVCAVAPNSEALIVGRAVAGVGSAGLFSGAILIIAATVPLAQRPLYTGVIGAMYGISSVAGPLLGGVFTDSVTWRLCFYINLPLGLLTAIFIFFFFHPSSTAGGKRPTINSWKDYLIIFDIPGLLVLLPTVVCLLLALQWGGSKYPWNSGRIIALLILFGVLALCFVGVQWKMGDNATVPGHILRNRTVGASAWFAVMLGGSFFALLYYVPIYFQAIMGVSATQSGIRNLPLVLSVTVFSIVSGAGTQISGYYTPWLIASSICTAVGAGLMSTWSIDMVAGKWIGYQLLYGAGVGFGLQLTLIAIQTVLPKKDVPTGTAIIAFSQTLGGAIFISVAQNINTNKLISNLQQEVPTLEPSMILRTGATEIRNIVPPDMLQGVLVAYNTALTQTFYVGVATAALSIFGSALIEWKSIKGKKVDTPAA
ncbi:major facilitator superfamily domain-containing protein [Elsinoe ampelina]|uniref:Major facilitator superfamily domain-containing protein n=1 Tax=Elsinoe ampelina TaxID=302913 RepID=A0A6A6G944_9PEZI|nr:major facilitator superfamily domain-containing protein [Elsinoe ampelina]